MSYLRAVLIFFAVFTLCTSQVYGSSVEVSNALRELDSDSPTGFGARLRSSVAGVNRAGTCRLFELCDLEGVCVWEGVGGGHIRNMFARLLCVNVSRKLFQ